MEYHRLIDSTLLAPDAREEQIVALAAGTGVKVADEADAGFRDAVGEKKGGEHTGQERKFFHDRSENLRGIHKKSDDAACAVVG